MPIAAAPAYLGINFDTASPAQRFGLLLPIWTTRQDQEREVNQRADAKSREGDEVRELLRRGMDHAIDVLRRRERRPLPGTWDRNDAAARDAWKRVCTLTPGDRACMRKLVERQSALAASPAAAAALLTLDAISTAPFTTGLGNEHPLENGFAFLNPYGLPYLPGSGVNGVLRQAARELSSGDWGDTGGWTTDKSLTHAVGKQQVKFSVVDALFGLESDDGDKEHQRGALMFWDVLPLLAGDSLQVEVTTPHQSHYYQQRRDARSGDSTSPHDSGQPNPIHFLTVPPGSRFVFHVRCDLPFLERLAPELARDGRWQGLLKVAMAHAFQWLGFGAKTAVGYGALRIDPEAAARREREAQAVREACEKAEADARRQQALAAMSPVERTIGEYLDARPDKNQSESAALFAALKRGEWSGETRLVAAGQVKASMQAARKWKEKSEKKNPQKDHDHQDTLLVMKWLARD